jgi:hypothetical protein
MKSILSSYWIVVIIVSTGMLLTPACAQPVSPEIRPRLFPLSCNDLGNACCHPLNGVGDPWCEVIGGGCDVVANRCVKPCGGPGQVCCDGSDTFASHAGASPEPGCLLVHGECTSRTNMCLTGVCSIGTHRCGAACGQAIGAACCPPDAQLGVASCRAPRTYCKFSQDTYSDGVCLSCGRAGDPPCASGPRCDAGLSTGPGGCRACGKASQVPCDGDCAEGFCYNGCSDGLAPLNTNSGQAVCIPCGDFGQPGCTGNVCHATQQVGKVQVINGICTACGNINQFPCQDNLCYATQPQNIGSVQVIKGVCTACGNQHQPPCQDNMCSDRWIQPINGVCTECGISNPCPGNVCRPPLQYKNGSCVLVQPCSTMVEMGPNGTYLSCR